uniref:Polyadenylate-binding protein n=1 Tax=Rhizochromulina marina TaxID=1034831 RepID=A0A7S2SSK9_9STRA|mmetsp:Transcript_5347/g.15713  ORF Transcript_5347/g.15713 Transcript_5347/m.15713 type:complete len:651 (+) Transcript_5347:106-2058(+)|eukprot:CAMPEP_0118962080 /NCGR_PEP_ID=MMETSP1173-20130426/543_1 /TAXON_ID=1034831 /ORGANISM="Rhizochromulina marina cf, Strain CCMP1243" /LENGTH=650 /DNA_ID=CAMNT_0006910299 /DNA_START=89 /DNA_END=2041 /DNA_ORIENTATION=-
MNNTAAATASSGTFSSASLYVGDLAPDVSEGKLFDIFNEVGPVASIRVCRDAMLKRSLGYAYVNFHNHDDAERALETKNYTAINGRPCRIMWSQRDPSLRKSGVGNVFVKNLHDTVQNKELMDAFSLFGNILSCKVAMDAEGRSKGYGYVHFETEEAAKKAIEQINEIEICGQQVEVVPYQRRERRPGVMDWTNLYVKNIPLDLSEAQLTEMFSEFGEVTSLKIMSVTEGDVARDQAKPTPRGLTVGASKGFGFVNFAEHEAAKAAADSLNGKVLDEAAAAAEGGEPKQLYVGRAMKKDERQRELKKKFDLIRQNKMQSYMGTNLYVKNIEDGLTDKELHAAFEQFGTITSARVMRDGEGTSKGFGFVCFSSPEEANAASNEMNNKPLNGKPIFVTLAQRREQRREMLSQAHHGGARGAMSMPRGMPMPGQMYGAMPMMYQGMPGGRGPYGMPMMMPGRGMPRGPAMAYPRGTPAYQVPVYPNAGPMQGGPMQQAQGGGRRMRRAQGGPGRGGAGVRQNTTAQQRPPAQQPGIKFTQQVRNHPGQPTQTPMAQSDGAAPANQNATAPAGGTSLTPAVLAAADEATQKNMIGEQLYPMIADTQPDLAGKITGMLLEMDNAELLHLIESPESLDSKISEALDVLKAHQAGGQ